MQVKLSEIADAMEMQSLEGGAYLDMGSGEFFVLTTEDLLAAEDEDGSDLWDGCQVELAREVLADEQNKRFVKLPGKWDMDEYRLMEKFIESVEDEEAADALSSAIRGRGAFRRFKDCAFDFAVIEDWYKYRDGRFKEIAIEWCWVNEIEYVDACADKEK